MRTHNRRLWIGAVALLLQAPLAAQASAEPSPAPASNRAAQPQALDDHQLQAVSGGQSPAVMALTNQALTATNSGNSITAGSVSSGAVTFETGAFQGFNGIGNFVINTGNNNNLQGSLSVTVVPLR